MKTSPLFLTLFGSILLILFSSGITRHDVSEEEYLKLGRQKQFDCVGQVLKDTSAAGSCVLISERYVLTAAHVLEDKDFRVDSVWIDGQNVIKAGGHWELIGICSGGRINIQQFMKTYYYGQVMAWTRVAVFVPWINQVTGGS